jgi:ATP-dependent Clp protease ATP-binding subunit ClpA
MFERFTERARRSVVAAQEEARALGHHHIGTEHLLLGLLHGPDSTAGRTLAAAGITAEAARAEVRELAAPGDKSPAGPVPFTPRARKILELALREALERRSRHIGTEHILLALMREGDDAGAQVLERLGGPLPALRQLVNEAASETPPRPGEAEADAETWAREWPAGREPVLEARVMPQTVIGYRNMLAPIDRRLAGIEQRLGIAVDAEPAAGFRGLLGSVYQRLANIERHVGNEARPGEPEAQPREPEAQPREPKAGAE